MKSDDPVASRRFAYDTYRQADDSQRHFINSFLVFLKTHSLEEAINKLSFLSGQCAVPGCKNRGVGIYMGCIRVHQCNYSPDVYLSEKR